MDELTWLELDLLYWSIHHFKKQHSSNPDTLQTLDSLMYKIMQAMEAAR